MKNKIIFLLTGLILGIVIGMSSSQITYKTVSLADYIMAHVGCEKAQKNLASIFSILAIGSNDPEIKKLAEYWEKRSTKYDYDTNMQEEGVMRGLEVIDEK